MGKELANPSIPHWITYCTVVVLHTRHLLLTVCLKVFTALSIVVIQFSNSTAFYTCFHFTRVTNGN
jgi:hypothetical protein